LFDDPIFRVFALSIERAALFLRRLFCVHATLPPLKYAINERISSTRHAVHRGLNLIAFGNRPDLTPAHQVERDTGMIAGVFVRWHPTI